MINWAWQKKYFSILLLRAEKSFKMAKSNTKGSEQDLPLNGFNFCNPEWDFENTNFLNNVSSVNLWWTGEIWYFHLYPTDETEIYEQSKIY